MEMMQAMLLLVLFIGFFGTMIPMVPGTGLMFGAILLYGFYDGWSLYSPWFAAVAAICAIISSAIDYVASAIGAKKFGAGKHGVIGSLVGGVLGFIFFNFPGLLFGSVIGLVAVEYYEKKDLQQSTKAAAGVLIGSVIGIVLQAVIAIILLAYVFIKIVV